MIDIDKVIELVGEDDIDLDFKVGGQEVVKVSTKDKNIDVTIFDAAAFKDLVRKVRRCKS
jgi:hypothetical protein